MQRYARVFACAEINSTFYKAPRASTWARWADSVPKSFRFSVKAPKTITHQGLAAAPGALEEFVAAASMLGEKLGALLFQLPPKQAFDGDPAAELLEHLREIHSGAVVLEPRHASWFDDGATRLLQRFLVARAGADPARVPAAANPLTAAGLRYFRLHGSPRTYYSSYTGEFLAELAERIAEPSGGETWVIFDNTASGAAAANALELAALGRER